MILEFEVFIGWEFFDEKWVIFILAKLPCLVLGWNKLAFDIDNESFNVLYILVLFFVLFFKLLESNISSSALVKFKLLLLILILILLSLLLWLDVLLLEFLFEGGFSFMMPNLFIISIGESVS